MTRPTTPSPSIERLAATLMPVGLDGPFASSCSCGWQARRGSERSPRRNRAKIHKKLSGARDDESLRDVRAELQVAHLFLADRRIELAYEAYGSGKAGPDFTITYRATRTLNVEVTRMRRVPDAAGVAESIVAKLRQLPPSVPNALVLAVGGAVSGRRGRCRGDLASSARGRMRGTTRSSRAGG